MAKVLVVDDSLSVRKVVERALVGRQMEVVCAATGSEALERIELDEPDVVVCDVVMPDRDGYEICEFVKRHPKLGRTPVLLMSGIVNDEVRERAARVNSADVLSKPFAADELLRRLDALLGAGHGSTGPIATPSQAAPVPVAPVLPRPAPTSAPTHEDGVNGHSRREAIPPRAAPAAPMPIAPPTPAPVASPAPPVVVPAPPVVVPAPPVVVPAPPVVAPPSPPVAAPEPMVAVPEPPARSPVPVASRPSALSPVPAPAAGSAAVLRQFAAIEGVQWAVLADREGFLLDSSGEDVVDAAVASALSACLTESSEGLGRELGRGPLQGMILEYAHGMVVLYSVGASALLAIAMAEPSALGKVRYFAKKSIPELLQAV
jgi:CheY-like chemotaxis protein/predicted regulator of Ras-like GTPase activity (Roadblock/LC7/MglB family)